MVTLSFIILNYVYLFELLPSQLRFVLLIKRFTWAFSIVNLINIRQGDRPNSRVLVSCGEVFLGWVGPKT